MEREQVDQEIRRLFALPLAQFIEARTTLERGLRAERNAEAAGRVKAVRKPSLSAWTVNLLARKKAKQVEDLIRLGEDLREAERRALAGGGGARLQEAGARRRKLIEDLLNAAEEILQAAGHSPSRSHLDQVQNTLLATATDEEVRERVREGTLEKEAPPPSGFGGLADVAVGIQPPGRGATRRRAIGRTDGATGLQQASARPEAQDRKRERARQRAEEFERQANEAEVEARRLRKEAAVSEEQTRKARTAAERSEARAVSARERAARARREAE